MYQSSKFLILEPGKDVRFTFAEGQKLIFDEDLEELRYVGDDENMSTPQEKALGAIVCREYNWDFYILDKFPN